MTGESLTASGVVGFLALVLIFHTHRCLYRAIDEMRKLNGSGQGGSL